MSASRCPLGGAAGASALSYIIPYAIVSFWIDEKSDQTSVHIDMKFTMGDPPEIRSRTTTTYEKMKKPKESTHRRGMKNL